MSWQYRLMKRKDYESFYELVEYYTDEDGSISWTEEGMSPGGETAEECKHDYELMAEAFTLPLLIESELEAEVARKKERNGNAAIAV